MGNAPTGQMYKRLKVLSPHPKSSLCTGFSRALSGGGELWGGAPPFVGGAEHPLVSGNQSPPGRQTSSCRGPREPSRESSRPPLCAAEGSPGEGQTELPPFPGGRMRTSTPGQGPELHRIAWGAQGPREQEGVSTWSQLCPPRIRWAGYPVTSDLGGGFESGS